MSKLLTKLILIALILATSNKAEAQQWLGRTTGNYSGTYGVYNNASSIADSKYKYYFNFWGRGLNLYNNYLSYNAPIKLNHWANNTLDINSYKNLDGKIQIGNDWFSENLNGKDKQFSLNQDIWGPAFMFPVSKNWNMSINTRQRSGFQFFGLSEDAARMGKNGIVNGQSASINKGFSANIQTYQELSFTLGGIMAKNENHSLSGGATIKLIRGLGAAYLKGSQMNILATGNNSALVNGDFQYAYTDDKAVIAPFNDPYGLFSLKSRGAGVGFDLGINYTYRSKALKHKSGSQCDRNDLRSDYDLKLSLALNDVGGIRYNRHSTLYSYSSNGNAAVTAPNGILDGFGIANQNGFDSIGKTVFAQMGASKSSAFNTALPTAFNFQADFRLSRHLFTAVYLNQSLKGQNTTGLRSTSLLSIIPRFESRAFEFSMPLTLSENYKNFYIGAYARIGPVFFGSDNLGGLLNVASASEFRGADIYGGVSFGIGHCHSWWYKDNVDPVYIDTIKSDSLIRNHTDTLMHEKKDTIILKDTVNLIQKDTVYIDKSAKNKLLTNKEIELKNKEAELNKRKAQLDVREKEINDKQKGNYNETEDLKDCNTKNTVLINENNTIKTKVNTQAEEIYQLKKQIEDLNKLKAAYDLEKQKCNEEKVKTNAEILKMQDDLIKANKRIAELEAEIVILKKVNATKTDAKVEKGTDAEKLLMANKQVDSMKLVILYLESDYEKCKKNAITNNAEVVKKAEADRAKAENDAKVIKKQSDSLLYVLNQRTIEWENCKKNSTLNSADVVKKAEADKAKAENDAKIARKQVDSIGYILTQRTVELENCKKAAAQNNAEVLKMKTFETDNINLKAELLEMSKTIGKLNTKNYVLENRIDSLIYELKNCCKNCGTGGDNNAELLKKCTNAKNELEAEIARLKSALNKKDQSLDSMQSIVSEQTKKQVELNAQIVKLNSDIADLKTKSTGANCDDIQKQLDDKTSELNKAKTDITNLQNQVKNLSLQMNELKTEYNYMVKQNQKCNMKLDSCMHGLFNNVEPGNGGGNDSTVGGKGGPHEGNSNNGDDSGLAKKSGEANDDVYSNTHKNYNGLRIGAAIINILLHSTTPSSNSGNSGGSGSSKRPTENNSGSTNSGSTNSGSGNTGTSGNSGSTSTNRPTETGSSTTGTSGNSNSGSNSDRSGAGTSGSTRRR